MVLFLLISWTLIVLSFSSSFSIVYPCVDGYIEGKNGFEYCIFINQLAWPLAVLVKYLRKYVWVFYNMLMQTLHFGILRQHYSGSQWQYLLYTNV